MKCVVKNKSPDDFDNDTDVENQLYKHGKKGELESQY